MKTCQSTTSHRLSRFITPLLMGASFILPLVASEAFAGKRVALVVGANEYVHTQALGNAVADSRLVATTLSEIGFEVIAIENPNVDAFYNGLDQFKRIAPYSEVAIVYFAGHGIEVDDRNYLLPIDAELTEPGQLRSQTVALDTVLSDMAEVRVDAKVVILDCCRNNPLSGRSWMKTRAAGSGLKEVIDTDLPEATLLLYSAMPGAVALDGTNGNSPFTEALSKRLKEPGQHLFDAIYNVSDDVVTATGSKQEPWIKTYGGARTLRTLVLLPLGSNPATTPSTTVSPAPVTVASSGSAMPASAPVASAQVPVAQTPVATAPVTTAPALSPTPVPTSIPATAPTATNLTTAPVASLPGLPATQPSAPAMLPTSTVPPTTTAATTTTLPPALPAPMPQLGSTTPPAAAPALPQIGNGTPPPAPAIMISLPGRGYFNNEEIFQYSPYASYNAYSKTEIIRDAQRKLTGSGTPDGQMGGNTQTAIQDYQRSHGLTVTGLLDGPTLYSLGLYGRSEQYPPTAPKPTYPPKPTYTPAPPSRTYADTPPTRTYRPEYDDDDDDDDDDDKKYKSDDDDDYKPKRSRESSATDQQIKDVMRSKAIQRVTRGGH